MLHESNTELDFNSYLKGSKQALSLIDFAGYTGSKKTKEPTEGFIINEN